MKNLAFFLVLIVLVTGFSGIGGAGSLSPYLRAYYKFDENTALDNAELVTNGTFAAWTTDNPDAWTVVGEVTTDPEVSEVGTGEAHGGVGTGMCNLYTSDGTSVQISQAITTLIIGRKYRVSINIDKITAGALTVGDTAHVTWANKVYTVAGIKTFTFVATYTNVTIRLVRGSVGNPNDITVDDVSIKLLAVEDSSGNDHDGLAQQNTDVIHIANGLHLRNALVTFIFDDGYATDYTVMKPVFDAQGEVACSAIISTLVLGGTRLSEAQLVEIEGAGWEILCHTKTHPHLPLLTEAEITVELSDSKTALEAMNLTIQNLVYPYNEYNTTVQNIAKDYFNSARAGGGETNVPMLNIYALASKQADDHTDLATYKELVDTAESEQTWLIFYLHTTDASDATAIGELIDYIQAKSISIVTVQQALDLAVSGSSKINGAFDFNGSSDYILIPDADAFTPALTPFSISAWVYMHDATNFVIASKGVEATDGEWRFYTDGSDKLFAHFYDESIDKYIGRTYDATALTANENAWIHLAMTYNGAALSAGVKLYLNGVTVDDADSLSATFIAVENLTADVHIGRYNTIYANGLIDDVMFFSSELSEAQVKALYTGTRGYRSRWSTGYRTYRDRYKY